MGKFKIDTQKIEHAISDFESSVDFELVPVIALQSTPVLHVKWIVAVFLMLLSISMVELVHLMSWVELSAVDVITYVSVGWILSLVLGFGLAKLEFVQRLLTFKSIRDHHVQLKAQQVFLSKRLYETHSNQGLLLFISLMEHRIVIMPDPRSQFEGCGIMTAKALAILQNAFKVGDYEKGLLDVIEFLKSDLAVKFPKNKSASNENQLPNKLIWWSE